MVQKVKDRIIGALIMTCSGIAVSLITIYAQNKNDNSKELEELIKSKLPKSEFIEYKKEHKEEHNKLTEDVKDEIKELKDAILVVVELKLTRAEVNRLKEELKTND